MDTIRQNHHIDGTRLFVNPSSLILERSNEVFLRSSGISMHELFAIWTTRDIKGGTASEAVVVCWPHCSRLLRPLRLLRLPRILCFSGFLLVAFSNTTEFPVSIVVHITSAGHFLNVLIANRCQLNSSVHECVRHQTGSAHIDTTDFHHVVE